MKLITLIAQVGPRPCHQDQAAETTPLERGGEDHGQGPHRLRAGQVRHDGVEAHWLILANPQVSLSATSHESLPLLLSGGGGQSAASITALVILATLLSVPPPVEEFQVLKHLSLVAIPAAILQPCRRPPRRGARHGLDCGRARDYAARVVFFFRRRKRGPRVSMCLLVFTAPRCDSFLLSRYSRPRGLYKPCHCPGKAAALLFPHMSTKMPGSTSSQSCRLHLTDHALLALFLPEVL